MIKRSMLATAVCAQLSLLAGGVNAVVLEEVVVTAQKREQSLQDVGIAVSAFSGEQMEQLGWDTADDVVAQAPGVTLVQPNGPSSFILIYVVWPRMIFPVITRSLRSRSMWMMSTWHRPPVRAFNCLTLNV